MNKLFIISLILLGIFLGHPLRAQTFKVNLSPKHASKVNIAKSGAEKLKMYRKLFSKDSTRQRKKEDKQFKKRSDSLARAVRKQEKLERVAMRKGIKTPVDTLQFLQQYASFLPKDSTGFDSAKIVNEAGALANDLSPEKIKELQQLQGKYGFSPQEAQQFLKGDSTARRSMKVKALKTAQQKAVENMPRAQRKQLEEIQKTYGPYSKEVNGYLGYMQDSVKLADTLKVIASQRAEAMATQLASKQLSGGEMDQLVEYNKQLEAMKNSPEQYKEQLESYKDPEKLKADAQQKAQEQGMENAMNQAEKLKAVQSKMTKMKGKFSSLLNSNDLSTGIKEKSLEGRPLRERWVIGGNFNVVSTSPIMVDLSPQFGYRIDKKFQVGISGIYRATFVDSVKIANALSAERYGYSVFSSYGLLLNFFAYTEWERSTIAVKSLATGDPKVNRQWVNSLLIGVGRQFKIHPKVKGSLLVLYNPLHKNAASPYHDALVIKTGFQLTDLALMKK